MACGKERGRHRTWGSEGAFLSYPTVLGPLLADPGVYLLLRFMELMIHIQ